MMKKFNSFQTKLMAFFIVLTSALLFVVGIIFLNSAEKVINSSNEKILSTLCQETSNKIERFLFERYGDIEVMAQSPLLYSDNVNKELKQQYLDSVRVAYKTYDYIFITDERGNIQITSGTTNNDSTYKLWINKVLKGKIFVSDFLIMKNNDSEGLGNIETGGPVVYFAAPIRNNKGEITGAVVERMNFNSIQDIVVNVRPEKKGYAYLMDEEGNTIPSTYGKVDKVNNKSNRTKLTNKSEKIFYSTKNKTEYVSVYSPIKRYDTQNDNWFVVVEQPVSEAFEVANHLRNYIIVVILISVLILFVIALIMSNQITKPLKNLVAGMQKVVGGEVGQGIQLKDKDEIGSLSQSFTILQTKLQAMIQRVLDLSGEAASYEEIKEYVEKFFDDVPSAIITVNSSGKITTFNSAAAAITGINSDEILNSNNINNNYSNIEPILNILTKVIRENSIYIKYMIEIKDSKGRKIPIMISTSIQKEEGGTVLGATGVFRKVEEVRYLEESVMRTKSLRALGELSAGMAHEIRNPLTSIKGYAQYIKLELGEQHELNNDISIIINEVDRLNEIINRFLTFARPRQPVLSTQDINKAVEEIIKIIKKSAENNDINLSVEFGEVPLISMDLELIVQALLNIVVNSIQVMNKGGELCIGTRFIESKQMVEIEIRDNGPGIEPEIHDKIFEPFFTTKDKGTGLGLAISSTIIENHKGFIEVNSTINVGTTFIIRLPKQVKSIMNID